MPKKGKGIIFGGKAHFSWPPTFQKLYKKENPNREIAKIDFDEQEKCLKSAVDDVSKVQETGMPPLSSDESIKNDTPRGHIPVKQSAEPVSTGEERKKSSSRGI